MKGLRAWGMALALLALPAAARAEMEKVGIPLRTGGEISGLFSLPQGQGPFPGIVALHGCGGLLTKKGKLHARETDWAKRLNAAGYAVLFPDSFTARGYASVCSLRDRPVLPERERVRDAYDALAWLQARAEVQPRRIALFGWSHGAMTALWAMAKASPGRPAGLTDDFIGAVAFYPGCAQVYRDEKDYGVIAPVLFQLGAADEWTPAAPCVKLAEEAAARPGPRIAVDVYAGSHHGFDNPTGAVHEVVVKNSVYKSGQKVVHVGRNPEARERAIARAMGWLGDLFAGAVR
ncbi:dienelactone hydrolase family protein [Oleispirillum naphthae]|uniref:dienelactone hydrolase family protein n=1 Tax=Oleispirillum naphthae TaxID=2838853 RepID=UPI0030822CE7